MIRECGGRQPWRRSNGNHRGAKEVTFSRPCVYAAPADVGPDSVGIKRGFCTRCVGPSRVN